MSTALALQDVSSSDSPKEFHTVRQRTYQKHDTNTSICSQTEDEWLNKPHDATSSGLPLDIHLFAPNKTFWITPHGLFSSQITIFDLTKDMNTSYIGLTNEYKAEVRRTLKDHSRTPTWTCHHKNWLGLNYHISDRQGQTLADWKHPWFSTGKAVLTFSQDSTHCSHPISLCNKRWGSRTEAFTVDSQPFYWQMDSCWHSTSMTLYKVFGTDDDETKMEVAKYSQNWWGAWVTGGTVVVDDRKIDDFVACLTLCVVLKKKRQRAAERRHAGE